MEYDRQAADRLGAEGRARRGGFFAPNFGWRPTQEEVDRPVNGYIHSIESMGLVDGPGVRAVVFLRGCRLRCRYCHNPDTWAAEGEATQAGALVERLLRLRSYFDRSGGGVTFSGGEPLLQPQFLLEALRLLKAQGIHTCLDTAGVGLGEYGEILSSTDLVLYDVKHWREEDYQNLTGREMSAAKTFEGALARSGKPVWVRHVVVPGLTDGEEHLAGLRAYVDRLPNVERVELLPYHTMGTEKYEKLGCKPPLRGVEPMDRKRCQALQKKFFGN